MARLFGRTIPDTDTAHRTLETMIGDVAGTKAEPVVQAQAWNLRYDSRSQARESAAALDWSSPDAFRMSYESYYDQRVRRTKTPDFALEHNRQNIVFAPGKRNRLHSSLTLVTLMDTLSLHALYQQAYDDSWEIRPGQYPFASYPRNDSPTKSRVERWLDYRMIDVRRRRDLIEATVQYIGFRRLHGGFFHPTWCAVYAELKNHPPALWPLLLGLGHWEGAARWWFAVAYSVERTEIAAIPTVLDSNLNPFFFPSPSVAASGYPIDLDLSRRGGLLREYIHSQCAFELLDHDAAKGTCEKTRVPAVSLSEVRLRHWESLPSGTKGDGPN